MVALTRLIGLVLPCTLVRMLRMPQHSSTSRTPGPALTPVPGPAGTRTTRLAPYLPMTRWGIVSPWSGDPLLPLHRLLRVLGRLFDGGRHFVGLAVAAGDAALVVADDDQGVEAETPAALDHGGATADLDDAFFQSILPSSRSRAIVDSYQSGQSFRYWRSTCDDSPEPLLPLVRRHSELFAGVLLDLPPCRASVAPVRRLVGLTRLQTSRRGRLGQRLDAAVIAVVAAVEGRLGDALGLGGLGQLLADRRRPP